MVFLLKSSTTVPEAIDEELIGIKDAQRKNIPKNIDMT